MRQALADTAAGKGLLRCLHRRRRRFRAVAQRRRLVGEDDLGFVDLGSFKGAEPVDLVHRKFGEKRQESCHIGVFGIAPELPEIKRGKPVLVQPDGTVGRLAHLRAGRCGDQRRGDAEDFLTVHTACQVDAADDVAPLVGSAHLQQAAIAAAQFQEVIGLKDRIVEFEEGERLLALEPQPDRVHAHHPVDREMRAVVTQEADIGEFVQP